jgi:hypothetical protein
MRFSEKCEERETGIKQRKLFKGGREKRRSFVCKLGIKIVDFAESCKVKFCQGK